MLDLYRMWLSLRLNEQQTAQKIFQNKDCIFKFGSWDDLYGAQKAELQETLIGHSFSHQGLH